MKFRLPIFPKPTPDTPVPFGYKCAWYAVRTRNIDEVVSEMRLTRVVSSSWRKGIDAAYLNKVFVTPPLGDWILIVGQALFDLEDSISEAVLPLLTKLSGPEKLVDLGPNENDVMKIAEAWSINPCKLDDQFIESGLGRLGILK